MATSQKIIKNLYRDSVALMQFSEQLCTLEGVRQASAVMGTQGNIALLVEAGLLAGPTASSPNDLLVVVEAEDEASAAAALERAAALLQQKRAAAPDGAAQRIAPRSIQMGLEDFPDAQIALISTPGDYAAAEARKALQLGLHVMMFSDNVSLQDEIALKRYAREHDLFVMGPDCGTAILNGIPLGFANVVRRGTIGVVAASGTGLQQVTCLIDRFGGGITQAIGTGGHDLKSEVGGITMLQGIAALAADPSTQVLLLVSKPPSPDVMEQVLAAAQASGKPVVADFIGADPAAVSSGSLLGVRTLEDAARAAVALAHGEKQAASSTALPEAHARLAAQLAGRLTPGQRDLRGLFSGGTFCYETLLLLSDSLDVVYSNTPIRKEHRLPDVWHSQGHTVIDLGDDQFTVGRPHPMIDFRLRNERILQEAGDPQTAVVLLDVVLGHGSHPDPAGELVPAITAAQDLAAAAGRELVFVGSVCGTENDPQRLSSQEARLAAAGVHLTPSNAQAARLAAAIVEGRAQ